MGGVVSPFPIYLYVEHWRSRFTKDIFVGYCQE